MLVSKYFAVATEGATTDGRVIQRAWLEQAAANYSPATYSARLWMEHMRGFSPESVFGAYGDVIALKTEENEAGKLVLFAQIAPTPEMVLLNKNRQKLFTSIELDHNFADTGEAYLVGLAVTDSPASLGTEMLQFSSKAAVNPLATRKTSPDTLFSEAVEFEFELERVADQTGVPPKISIFAKVKELLKKSNDSNHLEFAEFAQALETIATETTALEKQFNDSLKESDKRYAEFRTLNHGIGELAQKIETQQTEFKTLLTTLENTPEAALRTPASGAQQEADCL